LIGSFARIPRYQGAGSSQVNPTKVSNAYDELAKLVGGTSKLLYAEGYGIRGDTTEALLDEARRVASGADVAVIFSGLPDSYESEGFDRTTLDLPAGHNRLITAVSSVQPNVVIVLMNGSAVTMPWADSVKGIIEGWLGGQAGGGAIADVLIGRTNPSGKLAETFPRCLEDTPTFPNFPGRNGEAWYGEGIFIGYRHYDQKGSEPLFPFGFGLSYTTFAYNEIITSASSIEDTEVLTVEVTVQNIGPVAGKEVVQLYIREQQPVVVRPNIELKGFAKVALEPGATQIVRFSLTRRDFAYYDTALRDWHVSSGRFEILVGGSSRNLPLKKTIEITARQQSFPKLTSTSMLKAFRDHPKGAQFYPELLKATGLDVSPPSDPSSENDTAKEKAEMAMMVFLNDMPANKLSAFSQGKFSDQRLLEILAQAQ
ncbi:MAG TPA: glycoside hydrolase family 3 C-terminal domain-containing protein, partial [Terrimicrobiaceae bacterium]